MGYWNYRVVEEQEVLAIREVYYNDNGDIESYTEAPIYPCGNTIEELRKCLQQFTESLDKPVLVEGDFTVVGFDWSNEAK